MINSLPAFTNYTDIHNVLAGMKHQFRHDTVDCSIGKNSKGPLEIIFELSVVKCAFIFECSAFYVKRLSCADQKLSTIIYRKVMNSTFKKMAVND